MAEKSELTTPLHLAVGHCDLTAITTILDSGEYNLELRDLALDTPLHTAVKAQCYQAVQPLLNAGFDATAPDIENRSAINVGLRKYILKQAKARQEDADAAYKVMISSIEGSELLQGDMKNRSTLSTLRSMPEQIDNLPINKQSSVDVRRQLISDLVSQKVSLNTEVADPVSTAKSSLQKKYDSAYQDAKNSLGPYSQPEQVVEMASFMASEVTADNIDNLPELFGSRDADSRSLLHVASGRGLISTVDLLLSQGADKNVVDFSGKTIAHNPARFGSADMIMHLCATHEFDINQADQNGYTPFHHAQYMLLTKRGKDGKNRVDAYYKIKAAFQECGIDTDESPLIQSLLK